MGFIRVVLVAAFCQLSIGEVGGELRLSVVISAGQVKDGENRVRELAVFLRDVEPEQIENGVLIVYGNDERREPISEIRIRDHIAERTERSVKVFTNVKFDKTKWRLLEHPVGNLSYCCEFRVNDRVAASGCPRVQPRWMELLLPEIGNLPMRDLAIPGTHQSGTFKAFSKFDYLNRYRDCQEEDVFTQLLYGIRALDLRPGAVSKRTSSYEGYDYWIYHDQFYTQNALQPILEDVASFLDAYPNEVVIVAFHEFSVGFEKDAAFVGLEKLIEDVLGKHIYRNNMARPSEATLSQVIRSGKRAILAFQKDNYLQHRFFPGVRHIWGNTDDLKVLREKLTNDQGFLSLYPWFYSAMAQTTAQGVWSVIFDKYRGGVRGLAHRDNFQITSWYAEDQQMRSRANIIAMDYFASSDVVDVCQSINLERVRSFNEVRLNEINSVNKF